ncbi:NAD(P)/FAD-dependent oxidoreductase [Piscinibacter sp.]|uniref:NAD(P)/FAD-dependent oxidoreductase n=1 Tax=Piscinibacter sp. TaxID=1903157 RepID=UPI002F3E338D
MKHLVLLGGGPAHVQVLREFAALALPATRVTLVAPTPRLLHPLMLPGLVAGRFQSDDCAIALPSLAAAAGATFVEAAITGVDAAARTVALGTGETLQYDALSLDAEPAIDRDAIPGARAHALFLRPIESFVRLWPELLALAEARSLSVVVVGAGEAAVELALALQDRLRERARVSLVTGGVPLALTPAAVEQRLLRALKQRRITLFVDRCVEVGASHVLLGSGARLTCDAPVVATAPQAPAWLHASGLALDEPGGVAVGPTLQSLSHPQVFAVGDSGRALALNLRRFTGGGELQPDRSPKRTLKLLSCGEREAIAAWGEWSFEGRWVRWWKDSADRAFVAGARSLNRVAGTR